MKNASVIDIKMRSPLREAMRVDPRRGSGKRGRKAVMTLILTSLVDAFCIMLLYLLVQNSGNGSTIELMKTDKLPQASRAEALQSGTLVRVEGRRYFLGEKLVEPEVLAQRLLELKARLGKGVDSDSLIIQADRGVDFAMVTPVIRAASVSGFHKFKFAVIQAENKL